MAELSSEMKGQKFDSKFDLKDLHVTEKFRDTIETLTVRNSDLFASKDTEFGHIDTVKMEDWHREC